MSRSFHSAWLLLLAVLFAPSLQAQVVQCTGGTGTSIAGSVIAVDVVSGNLIFPTATVNCGQAVPALGVQINSPGNGASVFIGSSIGFQWSISNFNSQTDSCFMDVQPALPGTNWNLTTVTPSSPVQPYQATIPTGATPGQYSFRLLCNRDGALAATSEVTLNVQPAPTCSDGQPPLPGMNVVLRNWTDPAVLPLGGFGVEFGPPGPRVPFPGYSLINEVQNGVVTSAQVLSLALTAPPAGSLYDRGLIGQNPGSGEPFVFFSKCPGDVSWSKTRDGCAGSYNISWKLPNVPNFGRCLLQPGETYYLNVSFINRNAAQNQGVLQDLCNVQGGSTYSAVCNWWAEHNALSNIVDPTE